MMFKSRCFLWTAVYVSATLTSVVLAQADNYYEETLQNLAYGSPSGSSGYGAPQGGYGGGGGYGSHHDGSGYGSEPANYDFQYEVFGGGNLFGHRESRRGEKAEGKYHVLLPDGRRQVVTYIADESGYHPTITYEVVNSGESGGYGGGSGGYGGSGGSSGGYGDNSLGSSPQNRFSSRLKRQQFSPEENPDRVQIYSSKANPQLRFRNRVRRFSPKKGYLIVYPELPTLAQAVDTKST